MASEALQAFRIGLAGLGTVGVGVIKMLQQHADMIAARGGRAIEIVSVTASNKDKNRGVDLSRYDWADKLTDMAQDDRLDCVVEMIGGSEGCAKDFVEEALQNKKHVVTANKALLAHHGFELTRLAEENNVTIAYEAAVAGGIPIVKSLREGLAGNNVESVYGILNGTCNYILSEMRETGQSFDTVLKDAQEKGYAEADPSFDVDGIDAAHKIVLLGALAFGVKPDFDGLDIEGISHLTFKDIEYADELGYRIKLIGMACQDGGAFVQSMAPCLVSKNSSLGGVEGVFNAVMTQGDFVGKTFLEGRGAGEGPTASSVLADIMDLAKGNVLPPFGVPSTELKTATWQGIENMSYPCYIHLDVKDVPGVIADITTCLKDNDISIDSFIQKGHEDDGKTSIAIVTHKARLIDVKNALQSVQDLPCVIHKPIMMRVETVT
jgi:homoserine dehydrogenase